MKNWNYIEGAKTGNMKQEPTYWIFGLDEYKKIQELERQYEGTYVNSKGEHFKVDVETRPDMGGYRVTLVARNIDKNASASMSSRLPSDFKKVGNETMHEWATSKPKSVGNATIKYYGETIDLTKMPEHELLEILEELQMLHEYTDAQRAIKEELKRRQTGNSGIEQEFFKELADDAKEREDKDKQEVEKLVENRLDWSENLVGKEVWVKSKGDEWKCFVMQDKGDKVYIRHDSDGSQGWVSKERITGKVNNSKVGNSAFSGNPKYYSLPGYKQELDRINSTYEKELKKEQEDRSRGKHSRTDEQVRDYWERQAKGLDAHYSAKFKNSSSDEEYWKKQYIETARKKGVPENKIQEFVKKIEKEGPKGVMSTIKNSASDDKFAYVMREFDEGKLKTPDGKVVTDPAQAKAIAYSESKKTENGLTRARNAIKKS